MDQARDSSFTRNGGICSLHLSPNVAYSITMASTSSSSPAPVIDLVAVEKTYGDAAGKGGAEAQVFALRGVNAQIPAGELVAIIGPSGSGKSTLLNLMGALDRPTGGVVRIHGHNLAELDDDALTLLRRDRIGFVFQFSISSRRSLR